MGGKALDAEGQGGKQQEVLAVGWLILAVVVLSPVFSVFAELLARGLGIDETSNLGLVGMVVALITISITAPRTAKQLALIVAIVTAGGTLAVLVALAVELLGWGFWGAILGVAIGASMGSGLIILCYFRLGVETRRIPVNGET